MAKKKTWTVPVIKGTNIAWTEIWDSYGVELDKRAPEDYKFDATIEFVGFRRGYGAGVKVIVKDTDLRYINNKGEIHNIEYGVFLTDSYDIIMKMQNGFMTGTFTVCKRGQDYGIKLIN